MTIIYGKLIRDKLDRQKKEDKIRTKNSFNTALAHINKKKSPPIHKDVKYGKLYNKIVAENDKEDVIRKRLSQMSYGARNGQRKVDTVVEQDKGGVVMLGQLDREKPLSSITKEMIKEYQEGEKLKPVIINGEIRKYQPASYQPNLNLEEVKASTEILESYINDFEDNKRELSSRMIDIDRQIYDANENIKHIKNEINEVGISLRGNVELRREAIKLDELKKARKELDKEFDTINTGITDVKRQIERVNKENAEEIMKNKDEIIKFQQSLNSVNKNRLNLQQQPYESDQEYYLRLREIEKEKFDPVLYKKYAENETTKKLKSNLQEFFSDAGFNEEILSHIPSEDKHIINKHFDAIRLEFLNNIGYNNKQLSPRMVADFLKELSQNYKEEAATNLQGVIRRINVRKPIEERMEQLRIDRNEREERATDLHTRLEGLSRDRASTNIQRVVRGHQDRNKVKKEREQEQREHREQRAQEQREHREQRAQEQRMRQILRIQEIKEQENEEDQRQAIQEQRNIIKQMRQREAQNKREAKEQIRRREEERNQAREILHNIGVQRRKKEEERNREIAATNIQKIVKGNIQREKIYNMIENLSDLSYMQDVDTVPEIFERMRQQRSDKGIKRMPYKTNKNIKAYNVLSSSYKGHLARQELQHNKEAARIGRLVEEADARARAEAAEHEEALVELRERIKAEAKPKGKRGRKPKGSGIVVKPPSRRTVKISSNDKKKNRLNLVVSEIKAGNTNPKLILEVNKLYKQLYNIDNAYLFLKK